jgi:hypothetical protein
MTRLLLLTLLLSSATASAEWVAIGSSDSLGGSTIYVDPDTIRRHGNLVKIWQLTDLKSLQTNARYSYLSHKGQFEFECLEEQSRLLAFTIFSGNMGSGTVVDRGSTPNDEWVPVAPGSIARILWKRACSKQ